MNWKSLHTSNTRACTQKMWKKETFISGLIGGRKKIALLEILRYQVRWHLICFKPARESFYAHRPSLSVCAAVIFPRRVMMALYRDAPPPASPAAMSQSRSDPSAWGPIIPFRSHTEARHSGDTPRHGTAGHSQRGPLPYPVASRRA